MLCCDVLWSVEFMSWRCVVKSTYEPQDARTSTEQWKSDSVHGENLAPGKTNHMEQLWSRPHPPLILILYNHTVKNSLSFDVVQDSFHWDHFLEHAQIHINIKMKGAGDKHDVWDANANHQNWCRIFSMHRNGILAIYGEHMQRGPSWIHSHIA